MPQVDLIDETYVVAPPARVAAIVGDPASWRRWWPDLRLRVTQDRGLAGVRWTITGALVGSMEVWLEAFADGVIVHYYLRADPTRSGSDTVIVWVTARAALAERRRRARRAKVIFWALKDRLEDDRAPGVAR
ncbi:hypothetical protein BH20ACT5_BH20ACT5_14310 [soil metagenome]